MSITYEFPELPTGATLNMRGASQAAAYARAARVREAKHTAWATIAQQRQEAGRAPLMLPRADVHYTFFLPTRRDQDVDNLIGAAKPYLDALCPMQVGGALMPGDLAGDSWRNVRVHGEGVYRKGQPGFRITITPLEETP